MESRPASFARTALVEKNDAALKRDCGAEGAFGDGRTCAGLAVFKFSVNRRGKRYRMTDGRMGEMEEPGDDKSNFMGCGWHAS